MTCLTSVASRRQRLVPAKSQPTRYSTPATYSERRVLAEAATAPRGAASDSDGNEMRSRNINPDTGNPQTGKLIDEYLWFVPLIAVMVIGFWSASNVGHVLQQTSKADQFRAPADPTEWRALDNQEVYGPCGGAQGSSDALQDLLENRPCRPGEYNRMQPGTNVQSPMPME